MGRDLSHEEVVDLLGAYALDALEPGELQTVDRHVQGCKACLAEVADHREVAGLLTPGWAKPPPGLWDKIAASIEEVPPPLNLAPVIAMKLAQVRTDARPRRSIGMGIAAMVAVAAVAMIGFLGMRVVDDNRRLQDYARGAHADELQKSVNAALADPAARKVELVSTQGHRAAQAVVLPDGTGYMVRSNLPGLSKERTYQLWALVGTSRISVGVLGSEVGIAPFKIGDGVLALAITEEAAGGVETTKKDPVVVGRIQDT
ncbi:MAG: anti-sigma factor domain-containing protein [Acidimicrobiales bacterium]